MSDAQLTTVAQKSPRNISTNFQNDSSRNSPSIRDFSARNSSVRNIESLAPGINVTRYGMPEDHMSDATKHYLSQLDS